jgi:hypothetical protein
MSLSEERGSRAKVGHRVAAGGAAALVVGIFFAGCGGVEGDCTTICDKKNASCPATAVDCPTFCAALAGVSDSGGCGDSIQADFDCVNAQANVCDLMGACDDANGMMAGCIAAFCTANPTDENCKALASG